MTIPLDQEAQDIRIANLENDVAFYAEAIAMLTRGRSFWLHRPAKTFYPEDIDLDRQIRDRVMKGELPSKALSLLNSINRDGMTYAQALRRSQSYRRWELVLGRARRQLREAEEALRLAKAERGY